MTKARTANTPKIDSAPQGERQAEALAWATRQLRFEHLLGSLERRIAN